MPVPQQHALNPSNSPMDETTPSSSSSSSSSCISFVHPTTHEVLIPLHVASPNNTKDGSLLHVGRHASCDVRLPHASISRQHARIVNTTTNSGTTTTTSTFLLHDLGGKYGTTVNGQRLVAHQPYELNDGDVVVWGNMEPMVVKINRQIPEKAEQASTTGQPWDEGLHSDPHAGLTGRAKRQAEIDAMTQTFDQAPTIPSTSNNNPISEQPLQPTAFDNSNNNAHQLPITESLTMGSKGKAVSCLVLDPPGARVVVGSGPTLELYDMNQAASHRASFRSVSLLAEHGIQKVVQCAYSPTGDKLAVATTSAQPIILDREGQHLLQFARGDMYVSDPAKTVGHTAIVTGIDWHPLERHTVLTTSNDGSARLWNLNGKQQFDKLVCDKVFVIKNARRQKTAVTAGCFHPGGRHFVVGTACGSIQLWDRTRTNRPERVIAAAGTNSKNNSIQCLVYSADGRSLASRDEETVRIWNAATLTSSSSSSQPIGSFPVPSAHSTSNLCFGPDHAVICAPSSMVRKLPNGALQEHGALHFYRLEDDNDKDDDVQLTHLRTMNLDESSAAAAPVIVQWHPKLNQIVVGCSDGHVLIYYDRSLSRSTKKGGALNMDPPPSRPIDALSELLKLQAAASSHVVPVGQVVLTPFADDHKRKRKRPETDVTATRTKQPERPETGKHKTGAQPGGTLSFQQYVADQRLAKSKVIAGKDPREALLKYQQDDRKKDGKDTKD